jgi:hypothetical protein
MSKNLISSSRTIRHKAQSPHRSAENQPATVSSYQEIQKVKSDILDGGCIAKPAAARATCAQSVDLHSNFIYINQYTPHRVPVDGQMFARISFEAAACRS